MGLKQRLTAVGIIAIAAVVTFGIARSGRQITQQQEETIFSGGRETLYLWYTDEALTPYLSGAAVTYNENHNIRVVPVLESGLEYLENINASSLESNAPDLYILSHDSLEKAYLAGLATGYYKSKEEIRENWKLGKVFEPSMDEEKREALLKGWKRAVRCTVAYSEEGE